MSHPNAELVHAFLATSRRDGLAAALEAHATPDFIWWIPGMGEIQDRIVRLAGIMRAHFGDGAKVEIRGIVADDERVAVESEAIVPLKDGRIFHNHYHNLYLIRDGRIAEIHEYHDSAHANPIWEPIFAEAGA